LFIAGLFVRGFASGPETWTALIETTPPDAQVSIDGQPLDGTGSPRTRAGLITGDHTLVVERDGYLTQREVLTLAGGDRRLVVSLSPMPEPEPLAAAAQPPSEPTSEPAEPSGPVPTPPPSPDVTEPAPVELASILSPSGKRLSKAELAKQKRSELRAARVASRFRARHGRDPDPSDGPAFAQTSASGSRAPAAASGERPSKAAAKGGEGILKLNSVPWSEVYVDKRHIGHTPVLGLPLPAGKHLVELSNPDLGVRKKLRIKLRAGETLTKVEKLGR
jgi:hypothetical protein